jgi:hypothetical protein
MKILLLFLTFIIKSLQISNRYCINCKYYKPSQYIYCNSDLAICSFFPIKKNIIINMVTGVETEYYNQPNSCLNARANESLCGQLATKYQHKINNIIEY